MSEVPKAAGSPRPLGRAARLALCLAVFAALSTWELARSSHPWADLTGGKFSDHISHLNAARYFPRAGLAEWRTPLQSLQPRLTQAEQGALPPDIVECTDGCLFHVDGWPAQKPLQQAWAKVVRFYPPGVLLLVAPLAALYHFTAISSHAINRLLIVLFLAGACAGLFLALECATDEWGAACAAVGASAVLHWTLEGFYDGALLLPLLLCARFLEQRRGLAALLAFSVALLLHFRALYYAPWAIAAAVMAWREQKLTARDRPLVVAAFCCLAASGGVLLLVLPGLLRFSWDLSPLLVSRDHLDPQSLAAAGAVAAVALAVFAWAGAGLDAAVLGCLALLLTQVRQSYPWYTVALVPWLCAPTRDFRVRAALLAVFVFLALQVHHDSLRPRWLLQLFT